jgi:outer membrane protein TolC
MKKFIFIYLTLSAFTINLMAQQTIEAVITDIETNNTTLIALRKSLDAEKIYHKTDIFLQNPEAGFNYLWGNPSHIGNRKDFSISQTVDFPTAYNYKNKIANLKVAQTDLEYQKQLIAIRLEAKLLCMDLVYANARIIELTNRLGHAQRISESYQSKFEVGETNILEYNKARLNLLNTQQELQLVNLEQAALVSELTRLNGGNVIEFSASEFLFPAIAVDFEQWFATAEQNNPMLAWLNQEIEIHQKEIGLSRALSLPKLTAGYMSETVAGQQFKGITMGMSIPLWENRNKVKFAKANVLAMESITADAKIQFYNHLKSLHTKAIGLQNSVNEYRTNLRQFNNSDLLTKALEKGEISLINYMLEQSFYYESTNRLQQLERDMNKAFAELNQFL